MMFTFPNGRPDSDTMREIADSVGVSWDYTAIRHEGQAIGYVNGDESDVDAIKDAAESLLGVRPQFHDSEGGSTSSSSYPELQLTLSDTQVSNDGTDSVTASVELVADESAEVAGTITIAGDAYTQTFATDSATTETITTTADSGTEIDVQAVSDNATDSDIKTIEVTT